MPATNSDSLGNCLKPPGQFHRDTKRSSTYRDFAKTPPAGTQTATSHTSELLWLIPCTPRQTGSLIVKRLLDILIMNSNGRMTAFLSRFGSVLIFLYSTQ